MFKFQLESINRIFKLGYLMSLTTCWAKESLLTHSQLGVLLLAVTLAQTRCNHLWQCPSQKRASSLPSTTVWGCQCEKSTSGFQTTYTMRMKSSLMLKQSHTKTSFPSKRTAPKLLYVAKGLKYGWIIMMMSCNLARWIYQNLARV